MLKECTSGVSEFMTQLANPFTPFLTALTSGDHGPATIHGATGQSLGSTHTVGTSQHLQDEIGRHIGTIEHLTRGSASFHDAHGAMAGSAHDIGDTTVIHNKTGATEVYIHHGPTGHDSVVDAHGSQVGTIDHHGHQDVYHDVSHGVSQTVSHQ